MCIYRSAQKYNMLIFIISAFIYCLGSIKKKILYKCTLLIDRLFYLIKNHFNNHSNRDINPDNIN